jgi:hypothetical protein
LKDITEKESEEVMPSMNNWFVGTEPWSNGMMKNLTEPIHRAGVIDRVSELEKLKQRVGKMAVTGHDRWSQGSILEQNSEFQVDPDSYIDGQGLGHNPFGFDLWSNGLTGRRRRSSKERILLSLFGRAAGGREVLWRMWAHFHARMRAELATASSYRHAAGLAESSGNSNVAEEFLTRAEAAEERGLELSEVANVIWNVLLLLGLRPAPDSEQSQVFLPSTPFTWMTLISNVSGKLGAAGRIGRERVGGSLGQAIHNMPDAGSVNPRDSDDRVGSGSTGYWYRGCGGESEPWGGRK